MASTYVNDLRLNEMATGDESGNWGNVTNTNLELIGEALGYGTEGITTNADTHTSTIADGATDPVRAMYVKYTGSLDSACTITIAPNTVNRMHFIENGTSGSQNIIISQGSGANVTIPPGDVKAVYLDGAGSGAAVVDAFASLSVVDLKVQDDLTVTDDATIGGTLGVTGIVTLTDDLIIGDGKTIGSASDVDAMTIASNGQVTFSQTLIGTALDISGDIDVDGTSNLDVVDIDGAVDMASTLAVGGVVTANAGVVVDNITIDGTEIDLSSGDLTVDVAGNILLNADGGGIYFQDASLLVGSFQNSSSDFLISAEVADKDIIFRGIDDSTTIDALTLDMSEAGAATFNSSVTMPGFMFHSGDTNTFLGFPGDDQIRLEAGGNERISITTTETVINDDGANLDFRIQSDSTAGMFFVDGGTNQVSIGTTSPQTGYGFTVLHAVPAFFTANSTADSATYGGVAVARDHTGNGQGTGIGFNMDDAGGTVTEYAYIGMLIEDNSSSAEDGSLTFRLTQNASARGRVAMTLTSNGFIQIGNNLPMWSGSYGGGLFLKGNNGTSDRHAELTQVDSNGAAIHNGVRVKDTEVIVNDGAADLDFRVESTANTSCLKVDAAQGTVYFNSSSRISACNAFTLASPTVVGIETQNTTTGATNYAMMFRSNGATEIGFINVSNTGTTYDTGSDYRLKENITPIENALDRVGQLNAVKFDWISDGTSSEGFIAHEAQEVFPDAVSGEKDGKIMQGMDYGRITPLLVKAMQEQQEQINQLKAEIKDLKGE